MADDVQKTLLPAPASADRASSPSLWAPTRHVARLARRRPFLTLIALGTFTVSCAVLFLPDTIRVRALWSTNAPEGPDIPWEEPLPADPDPSASQSPPRPLPAYLLHQGNPAAPPPLLSHLALNGDCLEAWVARGELCAPGHGLEELQHVLQSTNALDSVWTWVNGSDRRHQLARSYWVQQHTNDSVYTQIPHDGHYAEIPPMTERHPRAPSFSLITDPTSTPVEDPDPDPLPEPQFRAAASLVWHGFRKVLEWTLLPREELAASKWFRDHDELKYSIRSVKKHLKSLRNMHVVATDFRHPFTDPANLTQGPSAEEVGFADLIWTADDASNGGWREGQWPQWIDPSHFLAHHGSESDRSDGGLAVHHHWDIFHLTDDAGQSLDNWKNRVLPTFNSFAIETQLLNIPGLSENFIYNNDDFFLGRDLATADFYTPLYGPVFRMQAAFGVDGYAESKMDPSGEWPQLHRSNWVLSQRFSNRKRPYIEHATKTFSLPLLQETRMMFSEAFALTASHRFRGWGHDVVTVFLSTHMTVERHREALLWSFLVARGDTDGNNYLDEWEMNELLDVITADRDVQKVVVPNPGRETLGKVNGVLDRIKFPRPTQTRYQFSSWDGYADYRPRPGSWPGVSTIGMKKGEYCSIDLPKCFPEAYEQGGQVHVNTLMKRVAFAEAQCGDCIIFQLMNVAGKSGIQPFLPANTSLFPAPDAADVDGNPRHTGEGITPFLPIGPTWQGLDYTLENVKALTDWPAESNRREFAMKLIQRYSYMMAHTALEFISLQRPQQSTFALQKISRSKPALVCINDDIVNGKDEIDRTFSAWLQKTYSDPLPFEL